MMTSGPYIALFDVFYFLFFTSLLSILSEPDIWGRGA